MIAFIDDHRGAHGVEPICKVLPVAPYEDAIVCLIGAILLKRNDEWAVQRTAT